MPKRGAIALAITTAALALVLSFKTPDASVASQDGGSVAVADPTPSASTASPSPSGSSSGGATATPSATADSSGTYQDGTYTGTLVETRYGPVQVEVTVSGGRITEVTALELPSSHRRSAEISSIAGPILADEALQSQSAAVDFVSGATFTSDAYARSLQAALDEAA